MRVALGPDRADASPPNVCLLSNGRYSVVLTQSGGGFSTWDGLDVTRWREDVTSDGWGQYRYVRDVDDGRAWSVGRQPLGGHADADDAIFGSDRAVFRRRDGDVETRYEIAVAGDADAEVRRVTLTNHGARTRTLEVTSYAEVSLNYRRADQAHPAFAKLFLETEYQAAAHALLCRRRPRAQDQKAIWAVHVLAESGGQWPGWRACLRDRPRQISGPGQVCGAPRSSRVSRHVVGDGWTGSRSDLQPALHAQARTGSVLHPCLQHGSRG